MVAENNDKQITLLRWRDALKLEKMIGEVVDVTDGNIEFGKDIEVDGKIKVNSKNDLCDKDGNPLDLGGGGGDVTKAYVDQQDEALQAQINVNTTDIETLEGKALKVMTLYPTRQYIAAVDLTDEQNTEFNTNPPDIVIIDRSKFNDTNLIFYKSNVSSYSIGYIGCLNRETLLQQYKGFKNVSETQFKWSTYKYKGIFNEKIYFQDKLNDTNYDNYEIQLSVNGPYTLYNSAQDLHDLIYYNYEKTYNVSVYKTPTVNGETGAQEHYHDCKLFAGDDTHFISFASLDKTDLTYKLFNIGGDSHNIIGYNMSYSNVIILNS